MNRARHLRNYGLHSWSGMVLGLFVYVVAFTGCFALFHHELLSWEDPAKRLPVAETPASIDGIFTAWLDEITKGQEIEFAQLIYPDEHEPYYAGMVHYHDETDAPLTVEQKWNTQTGAALNTRTEALSLWLLDFHRDLMWPQGLGGRTAGRTIIGIAGIILMLSILTGVIAHTKIVQEFFTLRYFRSVRLKWQDTHKVVGLWGLPFFTMIAFTGAVLGVVAILAPIVALLTFKGDQQALLDEVLGATTEPAGVSAPMLSMDALADYAHPDTQDRPLLVVMENWGDANARFELFYPVEDEMLIVRTLEIDGVTGDIIADSPASNMTPAGKGVALMAPLHYGTYGGIWLKFLYFVLGLALAVITVFGLMMWIERRLHGNEGMKSEAFYRRLSYMVTGVSVGLPLATASIFWLDKLYVGAESARLFWTGTTYFAVWFAGLVYAFIRRQDYRTTRELIGLTGALFMGLPILNAITTGDTILGLIGPGHAPSAGVDLALLLSGLMTLAVAMQLPKRRAEASRKKARTLPKADRPAPHIVPAE